MARERMVTRTVETANLQVLSVDVKTTETFICKFAISATIPEEKRLKYVQKNFSKDGTVYAAILATTVTQRLYGMPESKFIELAEELPPRTGNDGE